MSDENQNTVEEAPDHSGNEPHKIDQNDHQKIVEKIPEEVQNPSGTSEPTDVEVTHTIEFLEENDTDPLRKKVEEDNKQHTEPDPEVEPEPATSIDPEPDEPPEPAIDGYAADAVAMLVDMNASLCKAIGGGTKAEYMPEDDQVARFQKAAVRWEKTKKKAVLSPFQGLVLAAGITLTPSMVKAGLRRKEQLAAPAKASSKETKAPRGRVVDMHPDTDSEAPNAATDTEVDLTQLDYTGTKEYKEGRTRFKTHKSTGMYSSDNEGEYCDVHTSTFKPSRMIQQLIDAEYKPHEIAQIIGTAKKKKPVKTPKL